LLLSFVQAKESSRSIKTKGEESKKEKMKVQSKERKKENLNQM
jgi:hypothetical protein